MNKSTIIITTAGLTIGVLEALLYYNLGKNEKAEKFSFGVPKGKELAKTMGVVLVTSLLTAALTNGLEKLVPEAQLTTT